MQLGDSVIGVIAGAFGDDEKIEMIVEIAAYAGQVVLDLDADLFEVIGRPYAGLQKQLRRSDRA